MENRKSSPDRYSIDIPEMEGLSEGEWESGFTWKSMLAVLYSIVVFSPATIWLGLVTMGVGMGGAITYSTLLLFVEYSRLFGKKISKQEAIMIFSSATVAGGLWEGLVYRSYFIQSPLLGAFGISPRHIPTWWAPPHTANALAQQSFFTPHWMTPIMVVVVSWVLSYTGGLFFGLVLREVYVEMENLPFPMQHVPATAVVTITERKKSRLDVFVTLAIVGAIYGVFLYAVPTYTRVVGREISFLPIPWVDYSRELDLLVPGAGIGIGTDIGLIAAGFVIPKWVITGMLMGSIFRFLVMNPLLVNLRISDWATRYAPGMNFQTILQESTLYYWIAPLIGVGFAVGLVPIILEYRMYIAAFKSVFRIGTKRTDVKARRSGDPVPLWALLSLFVVGCVGAIIFDLVLVPDFPIWALILYEIVFPLFSGLIAGRMIGITGQSADIPYLTQLTVAISGHPRTDAWFLPLSLNPGTGWLMTFKIAELTRTKIKSFIKMGVFSYPFIIIFGFIFVSMFWALAPIPSATYPTPGIIWPINVMNTAVWITRPTRFFNVEQILGWMAGASVLTAVLTFTASPINMISIAAGLWSPLPIILAQALGLMIRIVCEKILGRTWVSRNRVLIAAGLTFGEGLAIIIGISLALITTGIFSGPF